MARYWRLVRLDGTGRRRVEEMAIAKKFWQQHFLPQQPEQPDLPDLLEQSEQQPDQATDGHFDRTSLASRSGQSVPSDPSDLAALSELTDSRVQRSLMQVVTDPAESLAQREAAELCLRCFISHQIEQVCIQLEDKFGATGGFTRREILPLVLDDDGQLASQRRPPRPPRSPMPPGTQYQTLASQILQNFDPTRASLGTWASRQTKQHPELTAYLLSHGIYLISDWAILNNTRLVQLPRVLSQFHQLSASEIERAVALLQVYHEVYRQDRLQLRQLGKLSSSEVCALPTPEQLTRMAQRLPPLAAGDPAGVPAPVLSPEMVMSRLQTLATQLRQYRIHVRGGSQMQMESLDQPEMRARVLEMQAAEAPEDEAQATQQTFLRFYQAQFAQCLDEAIAQATRDRTAYLERKKPPIADKFLQALHLFHCQGKSMGEIAPLVGLTAQFQVTRLMKLKEFRAVVRQRLLQQLRDRVREKVQTIQALPPLHSLDQQIEMALEEQIATVIQQAEAEAAVAKSRSQTSLFSQRLCSHLDFQEVQP